MAEENDFLRRIPFSGKFSDIANWLNENFALLELAIKQNIGTDVCEIQVITERPSTIGNIDKNTIYVYPDGPGQWSSAVYIGNLDDAYDATKWFVLATNPGDLYGVFADIQNLKDQSASQQVMVGYCVCSTAGAIAAKTVSTTDYVLTIGGNIRIKMEHANSYSSGVTLQIGDTVAKPLYYNGKPVNSGNTWKDGETIVVYYDGIKYISTNSLNNPPIDVVNDLTTGGENKALSAEMGKALKLAVDILQEINVDGITGFVPISSLNDLPLSPTSEQRGQAYILDNALYVYVGIDGDTLDGKYKSVQLVTLDWNDKVFSPPIFNGLGRMTLKKNVISDENVLTAAMLSSANTEYYIQYDYDLKGATVTLPANVTLIFIGGSIKNGTLIGNNTRIEAKRGVIIFDNITIQGTWDVDIAYSSWFKTWKRGYKIASVTENVGTLYDGADGNYYQLEDLTYLRNPSTGIYDYYVTSTLGDNNTITSESVKVKKMSYGTFRIEGDDTNYIAYKPTYPGASEDEVPFDSTPYAQYDDTATIQSLLDIRAKKIIIEEGVYMINCLAATSWDNINGLYFDAQNDCEIVFEGWLKAIPNSSVRYNMFDVIGCKNIKITGKGGIQGDLLEHLDNEGEYGHLLSVSNTKGMLVENITLAYAWGDCAYNHWWSHGRTNIIPRGNDQGFHTYKNVRFIYGGRTGLVYERGDNIIVDNCYFYGTGRVRGKATNSAVDIEPFNYADTPKRYVKNYEFKNNYFENSANGLRLERCINCSVHDNYFNFGWRGILIVSGESVTHDITSDTDRAYLKQYTKIYNNRIDKCETGITLGESYNCENIEVHDNLMISCNKAVVAAGKKTLTGCKIHDNTTYGCGQWGFSTLINCDIYNNKNYGCKMPILSAYGAGRLIYAEFEKCLNTAFHDNHFSLDYGISMFGLGEFGKEELYHGLPVGNRFSLINKIIYNKNGTISYVEMPLTESDKIHFYDNYMSEDFILCQGTIENFIENNGFVGGIASTRNETSEVFLKGDIFKSNIYGDEGVVETGGIISCSWLNKARMFEPNMTVSYGEIIKIKPGTTIYYKVCTKGGVCGETLTRNQAESGDATFLTPNGYVPNSASSSRIKIRFTKRGVCTSETRPATFLCEGRKMHETDTNKDITYNGNTWVYDEDKLSNDISSQITLEVPRMISAAITDTITDVEAISVANIENNSISVENNKYYTFSDVINTLTIVLPTIDTGNTKVHNVTLFVNVGSSFTSGDIQFTTTDANESNPTPIYYTNGFSFVAGKTYEIKASYNNIGWIVSAEEIISSITPQNNE